MSQRSLNIAGLANARDLGGLERRDGTATPFGVFLRSEALDLVTEAGWDDLRARGVATVIDLRRPDERTVDTPDDIDLVAIDLDGDERSFWEPLEEDGRWGTPLYYPSHLAELPHRMHSALEVIAQARPGAVLFHCAAGWDRTGFVTALLLRVLDVTVEAASADYALSFENAAGMNAIRKRSSDAEGRRELLARHGHTPESAFASVYEELALEQWFAGAGVSPQTCDAIRTWRGAVADAHLGRRSRVSA